MNDRNNRRNKKSEVHIALLRGINVGGRNKLPMQALIEMFINAGCEDVQTYIQSGNVVFQAKQKLAQRIPELITQAISNRFDLVIPVVTRSAEHFYGIIHSNPFLHSGIDPKKLHVAFLANQPDKGKVVALDPDRSPPDEFRILGREIFLHLPNGNARTKFTNTYFDSKLNTISTVRNWNTVLKLLEIIETSSSSAI